MAHGEVRPHVFEETEGDAVDGGHVDLAFFYHRHAPQMSAAKLDLGKERSLPQSVAFVLLVHQLSEEVAERVHTAAHSCSKPLALFEEVEGGSANLLESRLLTAARRPRRPSRLW